ncbi:unnamed protein product, partial [marine sediment metagenome]
MIKTTGICAVKGGTGKTTLSLNLAHGLMKLGYN